MELKAMMMQSGENAGNVACVPTLEFCGTG